MMHLSEYMALKGLKDEDVAAEIGRRRVTVSRIRRGIVRPDWKTIEAIKTFTKNAVVADDFLLVVPQQKKKRAVEAESQ